MALRPPRSAGTGRQPGVIARDARPATARAWTGASPAGDGCPRAPSVRHQKTIAPLGRGPGATGREPPGKSEQRRAPEGALAAAAGRSFNRRRRTSLRPPPPAVPGEVPVSRSRRESATYPVVQSPDRSERAAIRPAIGRQRRSAGAACPPGRPGCAGSAGARVRCSSACSRICGRDRSGSLGALPLSSAHARLDKSAPAARADGAARHRALATSASRQRLLARGYSRRPSRARARRYAITSSMRSSRRARGS